jgi:hypothetical protein
MLQGPWREQARVGAPSQCVKLSACVIYNRYAHANGVVDVMRGPKYLHTHARNLNALVVGDALYRQGGKVCATLDGTARRKDRAREALGKHAHAPHVVDMLVR